MRKVNRVEKLAMSGTHWGARRDPLRFGSCEIIIMSTGVVYRSCAEKEVKNLSIEPTGGSNFDDTDHAPAPKHSI